MGLIEGCLNSVCPWSGNPVAADSLTVWEGRVVGFCNPGCRSDFDAGRGDIAKAVGFFEKCLMEIEWAKGFETMTASLGAGVEFNEVFRDRGISVEIYAPDGEDKQTPHDRDELYLVKSGSGVFVRAGERVNFGIGDLIFVPKGVEHRFVEFSDDFVTWVIFYS